MKLFNDKNKDAVKEAFYLAEHDRSNLREYDRDLYGYSGKKIRHAINNICSIKDKLTYVELGVYRGSTMIAATYNTKVAKAYGVDDFTIDLKEATPYKETGWSNPRIAAEELFEKYKKPINLIKSEARSVDFSLIPGKIDIIHYDLDLHHASLESILRYYLHKFDKHTLLIISNWNARGVRTDYKNFAKTPGISVELLDEKLSSTTGDTENWYNGLSVSLVSFEEKDAESD